MSHSSGGWEFHNLGVAERKAQSPPFCTLISALVREFGPKSADICSDTKLRCYHTFKTPVQISKCNITHNIALGLSAHHVIGRQLKAGQTRWFHNPERSIVIVKVGAYEGMICLLQMVPAKERLHLYLERSLIALQNKLNLR